ncbi:microtubule-associated protein 10 [Aulostomus maculatus]
MLSFEFLVDVIRVGREANVSDELAVGVRLLDFPTLLIYQPERRTGEVINVELDGKLGEYRFNRGKSCVFKMNLDLLHMRLAHTPLYAMVLDVKEDIPKLVGTSLISLAKVMGRIRQEVAELGVSTQSAHGERGLVNISNLSGEKVGSISVSYKLITLGVSLLPGMMENRGLEDIMVHRGQNPQEDSKKINVTTKSICSECEDVQGSTQDEPHVQSHENLNVEKQDDSVCISTQKPRCQTPQTPQENKHCLDEDLTVFCPPHLYYRNSGEEERMHKRGGYKLLIPEAFTVEDKFSDDEGSSVRDHQTVEHTHKKSSNQEANAVIPNVLGEAVRQLPLLNALLVELSQLNTQNPHQPLSIHPNLAWLYRTAAATEPSAGQDTQNLQNIRQGASPGPTRLHSPRNSPQIMGPASKELMKNKHKEALIQNSTSSKCPKKTKLVYGTTRTFNLRLKKNSSVVKRRECVETETQSSVTTGKTKCSAKMSKFSSSLRENTKARTQKVDDVLQRTVTLKQGSVHASECRDSPQLSNKSSSSGRDADSVTKEHHRESNQSLPDNDIGREKIGSVGCSSLKSAYSGSSSEDEGEVVDYADDFNSLESSDAFSPELVSSPEAAPVRSPKAPAGKSSVLPAPIQAPGSPQRVLRGTHVIQPGTQASALSFSSEDGERAAFVQNARSRGYVTERSSGAESLRSSRGGWSASSKSSSSAPGCSNESVSSLEPQELGELEDQLGSLDFRKEYQHVSELVANKLPGYTM